MKKQISALLACMLLPSLSLLAQPILTPVQPSDVSRLSQWVAAHRGGEFTGIRQGTLPQFQHAIQEGANVIEMDIRLTKDGIPVIHHNAHLGKPSSCSGRVTDYTLSELMGPCQTATQSERGEFIPTLEAVLALVDGQAVVNLEPKTAEAIGPVLQLIAKRNAYEWSYLSAYPDIYKAIRAYESDHAFKRRVSVAYNPAGNQKALHEALGLNDQNMVSVQLHYPVTLTCKNVRAVHEKGLKVSANSWPFVGFNERLSSGCSSLFQFGVDIALTNNVQSCELHKSRWLHNPVRYCEAGEALNVQADYSQFVL